MIARLVYRIWGRSILRMLAENEMRDKGMEGLTFAFPGPDGHEYYTWKEVGEIPAIRIKRIEELLIWSDAKVTKTSIEKVIADVSTMLPLVISPKDRDERSRNAAKVITLMNELLLRSKNVIPEELYYQIAAACLVRKGENPRTLDEVLHEKKAAMLREAGRAGADFFTHMSAFKQLLGAWLTSAQGLSELLINWMMEKDREKTVREALLSGSRSKSTERSSMTSPSGSPVTTSPDTTA